MSRGPVGSLSAFYHRFFPERQIYHRCNGQVQFTTVSGSAQIVAILVISAVLGWVAYATVNVVFTEQINERIKADLRDSTRRWEAKLAEMQGDYERLHAAVAVIEDELTDSLHTLEERQRRVDMIFHQKAAFLEKRTSSHTAVAKALFEPPESSPNTSVSVLNMEDQDPTPRRSRYGMAAAESSVNGLADLLRNVPSSREHAQLLEQRITDFENIEQRVLKLETTQHADMIEVEERATADIQRIEEALASTGQSFEPIIEANMAANAPDPSMTEGQGGPFISLRHEDLENSDPMDTDVFFQRAFRVSRRLQRLAALNDTIMGLPVTRPVDIFRISSGFGPRHDPILNRIGMHAGIDFAGRPGTTVVATAAGTVVKSAYTKGYGNMVRVDHGNGFSSIYAHLSKRKVKKGQTVERGDPIGAVGNTGRSTGPHLHYEIRYKGEALNPMKFLEAGRYVFENQG